VLQKRIKNGLSLGLKLNPNSTYFSFYFSPKCLGRENPRLKEHLGQIKVLFGAEKGTQT
jgi:hypothetical protein